MTKIENCINIRPISKTLRFRAIPQGKTQENIVAKHILENDNIRNEKYKNVKKYIDRYHKMFISDVLSNLTLSGLQEYADLFFMPKKEKSDKEAMKKMEKEFRTVISHAFKSDPRYKKITSKEVLDKILPTFVTDEKELEDIAYFKGFYTIFNDFNKNRENMYVEKDQTTAIAHRCIADNLPRFLNNVKIFEIIKERLDEINNSLGIDLIETLNSELKLDPYRIQDCFTIDFFNLVLPQEGIDTYNTFIGGIALENQTKIKGLNEYINQYNQTLSKDQNDKRIPEMTKLYKQILSDAKTKSFIPDKLESDEDVLDAVHLSYYDENSDLSDTVSKLIDLFDGIQSYNLDNIYIKNDNHLTQLSNKLTKEWDNIRNEWYAEYDKNYKDKTKNTQKYEEKKEKEYKKLEGLSIRHIETLLNIPGKVTTYYKTAVIELGNKVISEFSKIKDIVNKKVPLTKSLLSDDVTVSMLKSYLDAVKELEWLIKAFIVDDKVGNKDIAFYSTLTPLYDRLKETDSIYDKVRNYVTQKPYSKNKYKLYFDNPLFLDGWNKDNEPHNRCTILIKDGKYYLVVIDKARGNGNILSEETYENGEYYEWLNYKQITNSYKNFPRICIHGKRNKDLFNMPPEIESIYDNESFKKGPNFNLDDCHKLIDYYKKCIELYGWQKIFNFQFKPTDQYNDMNEFYNDVDSQAYRIIFDKISADYVNRLVDEGKIYLFQIYNKDFAEHSHGKKNLHTMYFETLFDKRNLTDTVIKLSGQAMMFMRNASLKKNELIVHPKNNPIANKNPDNPKTTSTFQYDIFKDKRYSEDQYMLHIPIQINPNAVTPKQYNSQIRKLIKDCDKNYIIGVDRGERNLLYICVMDEDGNIVEQFSLNEIINEHNGHKNTVNYRTLLDKKEKERNEARQNWTAIENIKELKEGYISQVVHKICELVAKYDAIIAMEDLTTIFKTSRVKIEKQIYQKFEKMLCEKLNYMADKNIDPLATGGILKGYQLAEPVSNYNDMVGQNGFIFYISTWLNSNVDPATGFVDLLKPKCRKIADNQEFIKRFDAIVYDKDEDTFVFKTDFSKFPKADAMYRKKWDIYMNGTRIRTFRNPDKNYNWENETLNLSVEMKNLLNKYGISYLNGHDLREDVCAISNKPFYEELFKLMQLMLQMRNRIMNNTDIDYVISPVKDSNGTFFDSRKYKQTKDNSFPWDTDALDAYNTARKTLWVIKQIKNTADSDLEKMNTFITKAAWLEYIQS